MKKIFLFAAAALMSVSMFADNISCADAKTKIDASDKNEWTVEGYVTEAIDAVHPAFMNLSFWMADEANGGQVFEVYRLSVKDKKADEIPVVGDKVAVTATLKKYTPKSGDPVYETDKIKGYTIVTMGSGTRYTDADLVPIVKTVAECEAIAGALGEGETSKEFYEITGYVNGLVGNWENKKQSFWIIDKIESGAKSNLEVFNGNIEEALVKGDKVKAIGQLQNYKSQAGKQTLEVVNAKLECLEKAQGIEDVVLTEKAQKVMVDGVVYIVRDGKMYNALGTQVR